jgi:L-iditol 2-dehydrogenase
MRAAVLYDVERIEIRDVPVPDLKPTDVRVKVSAVGLCGTDFHIYAGHSNYNTDDRGRAIPLAVQPHVLGHEVTGVVADVGQSVNSIKRGDRVVIDQGINCVSRGLPLCEYCESGNSHQCLFYAEHGITGLPGGLAEFISIPAANAIPIESGIAPIEAALTEPLGCVIHACEVVLRTQARYGVAAADSDRRVKSVVILGAGPAGLLFTQYLREVLGYDGLLLVSDPNPNKRALAASFGAQVVDPSSSDLLEEVRESTKGRMIDLAIEASGSGRAFASIGGLIRKQATVLLYGHGHQGTDLSVLNSLMFLEPLLLTPVGASGGFDADGRPSTYRRALRLLEEEKIQVAPFITHRYDLLDRVPEAFSGANRTQGYIKGVVEL